MSAARRLRRGAGALSRLGIRKKLNLLLVPSLAAVVLVATPFIISEAGDAASAARTADTARQARELGDLTWELQRERLLIAAFLASPSVDKSAMERQQRTVTETVDKVRASLGSEISDEVVSALTRLGSLDELRQSVVRRGASPDSVARTYHAVISAIIDAARLVPQRTSDADGTRQLTAVEALLRANEQNALRGMALIVRAVNRQSGQLLLDDAVAQANLATERFVQQADVEHASLVVKVDEGEQARRVNELGVPDGRDTEAFVADALARVEAQSSLRRTVQDQVTSEIADSAAQRADSASSIAWTIGLGSAALFGLVALLAFAVSRSIANPLRRLTTAAAEVAELADRELVRVTDTEVPDEQVPRLNAIQVSSQDEIGELAKAFNRVQGTATELVARQAVTRHNVSLMFANVAKRTQNLVGRQLALVDELERNEQDERLLAGLYRLDHLSTRLRRTADNLLVVAGTREDTKFAGPMELGTALRSALAEIEDYQRVQLGNVSDILLAPKVGTDLISVFAELLENSTSFSPPESTVEVDTVRTADGSCMVRVVDHGIGMTAERLADENQRLVERERLDIAPTSMLGLFVVGRLARRHNLAVELAETEGGGVTVLLTIPSSLFMPKQEASPAPLQIPVAEDSEDFDWFPDFGEPEPEPAEVTLADEPSRGGLRRRVPGAQVSAPPPVVAPKPRSPIPPRQDAAVVRNEMNDFQSAFAKATADAPVERRGDLSRRVPGANLAPGLSRPAPAQPAPARKPPAAARPQRDPAAERAALDAFTNGLALGAAASRGTEQRKESTE